jgi:hypothetical protein
VKGESPRPGVGSGGRIADLLERPPQAVYRLIMEAPDLDHDDGGEAPPPKEDGDHLPDPDWRLVGLLSFMASFCAVSAVRYAHQLVKVLL